jgi:hypothetical protein
MHYPISLSAFTAASWRGFPYAEALARMRKERDMPRTENTRRTPIQKITALFDPKP